LLTTNAKKPFKGSNDADCRQVFLAKRNAKLPLAVEAQGQIEWGKKI